ncbi:MAG TPA: FliM/FliN family flagellar motor C-terminal domain-containing protein [Candidatus Baltobacteraceae bacterium]|jgi:flagellar motor switch protein FliM|nr:FliM/FliN family flagellar motor C-terminal domain-containing protein [Candidatus Baltobacteraceae bacterium]
MIASLEFGRPQLDARGRRVARPMFRTRSTLPLSAACVVANGAREQLSRLLGREVDAELIEPTIPSGQARAILFANARIVCVRGRVGDAFVIVRPEDARRMVCIAFDEKERVASDPLSEIERQTLERVLGALVPLCASLCGAVVKGEYSAEADAHARCATYFEVRILGDLPFALGFGLSRDPIEELGRRITMEHLAQTTLAVRGELAKGRVALRKLTKLEVGSIVPFESVLDDMGRLVVGRRAIARGTCGVAAGRTAFAVTDLRTAAA